MSQILEKIKDRDTLPPLPDVVVRVHRQLNDPENSAREISKLITSDPVLTGRVLKVCNSARYSTGLSDVKNLRIAITRLGRNELKNIVYRHAMLNFFKDIKGT